MADISEDDIKTRAYALWEAEGHAHGSHDAHWLQALRQLTDEAEANEPKVAEPAPSLATIKTEPEPEPSTSDIAEPAPLLSTPETAPLAEPSTKKRLKTV